MEGCVVVLVISSLGYMETRNKIVDIHGSKLFCDVSDIMEARDTIAIY